MNLSESTAPRASDFAPTLSPAVSQPAQPSTAASSAFANALVAAKNAVARFDGRTPSAPAGKNPTLHAPHQTTIPVAPDSPIQALLASAAAGAATVMQSAQNAFAPNAETTAAPNAASALTDLSSSVESAEDSAANASAALEKAAGAAYRALDSIAGTIQTSAVTASSSGGQPCSIAASPNIPAANGSPAGAGSAAPQNTGSTGSKFLDSILESLPIVGNVMRLMQGSESHIDPAAVAFAKSGASAQSPANGSDSATCASSGGLAQNSPSSQSAALASVPVAAQVPPAVLAPEVLSGLPAIHQITPQAPSNSATRAAASSPFREPQNVATNAPVNASSSSQQSISDARSTLAQKVGAEMQSALASSNPQSDAGGSPSTGQQGTSANSDHSAADSPSVNPIAAAKNADATSSGSSAPDSSASSLPVPVTETSRAVVASESATLKAATTPISAASAGAANTGAFAQAVSTTASQGAPSLPQSSAAADAKSLAQSPLPSPGPLPNPANAASTPPNTELRVQMQTDLLGSIDLRAAVHQSTLTATIGVQREDVQTLLANELPALQHALNEKNLQVAQISVLNHSGGGSLDSRNAPHDPRREQPHPNQAFTMPYVQQIAQNLADEAAVSLAGYNGASAIPGRLSILV